MSGTIEAAAAAASEHRHPRANAFDAIAPFDRTKAALVSGLTPGSEAFAGAFIAAKLLSLSSGEVAAMTLGDAAFVDKQLALLEAVKDVHQAKVDAIESAILRLAWWDAEQERREQQTEV